MYTSTYQPLTSHTGATRLPRYGAQPQMFEAGQHCVAFSNASHATGHVYKSTHSLAEDSAAYDVARSITGQFGYQPTLTDELFCDNQLFQSTEPELWAFLDDSSNTLVNLEPEPEQNLDSSFEEYTALHEEPTYAFHGGYSAEAVEEDSPHSLNSSASYSDVDYDSSQASSPGEESDSRASPSVGGKQRSKEQRSRSKSSSATRGKRGWRRPSAEAHLLQQQGWTRVKGICKVHHTIKKKPNNMTSSDAIRVLYRQAVLSATHIAPNSRKVNTECIRQLVLYLHERGCSCLEHQYTKGARTITNTLKHASPVKQETTVASF